MSTIPGGEEIHHVLGMAREYLAQQDFMGLFDLPKEDGDEDEDESLEDLHRSIENCQACRLSQGRRMVVFGSGNPNADILFVGEAPGAEEDRQGLPFVGASGQLLTRMIESIGLHREDVYIANIVKCRPPGNRDPKSDEIEQCEPFLVQQLSLVKPSVICTLGRFAVQALLKTTESIGRLRGKVYSYQGIVLIPTYHPAALLRNPQWKRPTWEDLKLVRRTYDGTVI